MLQNPVVADVVETAPDVAFEYPLRRLRFFYVYKTLLNDVLHASFRSEAVRIRVGSNFRQRFQREFVENLHSFVVHSAIEDLMNEVFAFQGED